MARIFDLAKTMALFREKYIVDPITGCWNWIAFKDKDGYGYVRHRYKGYRAHRFSYYIATGRLDAKKLIHHKCENKACVNPAHLEELTAKEHIAVTTKGACALNKLKTHCLRGHEYTPKNTGRDQKGRYCIRCAQERYLKNRCKEKNIPKLKEEYFG